MVRTAPVSQKRSSFRAVGSDPRVPDLSIRRRCVLLGVARSGVYRMPRPANDNDLSLMRRMGIAALRPKPRTTKPAPGHKIFPYLLGSLVIERPNQSPPRRRPGCGRPISPMSRSDGEFTACVARMP